MNLVLLCGLDGTGLLYTPLLNELPLNVSVRVITYSTNKSMTYSELIQDVKAQLPTAPFILVAESFSGKIAFELSLDCKVPIIKLVMIASFITNPYPKLAKPVRWIPLSLLLKLTPPKLLIKYYCFGEQITKKLTTLFLKSIKQVDTSVLASRLRLILSLEKPTTKSNIETIIINATNDRLIPKNISKEMKYFFNNVEIIELKAPHFLAQTQAPEIASLLKTL